jgi:septation ring formation regulator EzrA
MFRDRVQQALHALESNRVTLHTVLREFEARQQGGVGSMTIPIAEFHSFQDTVHETIRELGFLQSQIRLIGQRLDQATETVLSMRQLSLCNPPQPS